MNSIHGEIRALRDKFMEFMNERPNLKIDSEISYHQWLVGQAKSSIATLITQLNRVGWEGTEKLRTTPLTTVEGYWVSRVPRSSLFHGRVLYVSHDEMSDAFVARDAKVYLRSQLIPRPEMYRAFDPEDMPIKYLEHFVVDINVAINEINQQVA